jgi:hypothetical protein
VKLTKSLVPEDPVEAKWGLDELTTRAEVLGAKACEQWPHPDIRLTEQAVGAARDVDEEEIEGERSPLVDDTLRDDALEPASDESQSDPTD